MTINELAAYLTDDPDILLEMGGIAGDVSPSTNNDTAPDTIDASENTQMNATELAQQADEMTSNPETSNAVTDQLKAQQEAEQVQQQQKQRILKPQFDQLDTVMQQLQTGVLQGKQAAKTGNEQIGMLDKEMLNLNTLLGNLRSQV